MIRADRFSVFSNLTLLAFITAPMAVAGCWDEVSHECDCGDDTDTSTASTDTDADTDTDVDLDGGQRSGLPDGWQGFGEACETDDDCQGYPGERRCIHDILSLINVPGGYCTSCCDAEEIDGCDDGIDCVGANNVYLVCLAHCDSDEDCRQGDGYECRSIYYISDVFPGNYCLPNEDLVEPDTDNPQEVDCPWPWL